VNVRFEGNPPLIPIRFEEGNIAVKVPAHYAAKLQGPIQRFGTNSETRKWQKDGSWIGGGPVSCGTAKRFL